MLMPPSKVAHSGLSLTFWATENGFLAKKITRNKLDKILIIFSFALFQLSRDSTSSGLD